METARQKIVNRPAVTIAPAASRGWLQRKAMAVNRPVSIQRATRVSSPQDPAEKEADITAKKIMRMALPDYVPPHVQGYAGGIQRHAAGGPPALTSNVSKDIQGSMSGGSPMPGPVRQFMEPRFRANFSGVRIHTGDSSARLARQVNARAFTVSNHIFFGKNQFQPDSGEGRDLIAHELTHTIQQGSAVQRSEDTTVTQQSPVQVQRLFGISLPNPLNWLADKANIIPGFRMFTIILGVNPINMSPVERSPANILRALIEFIPGGGLVTQALDNHGVFDKVGNWVEQQIRTLGMAGSAIKQAVTEFIKSLGPSDLLNLGGAWDRAKRIFTEPIERIINFAKGLITGIIKFVKDAILRPLAKLAEGTRGYDLLKAILGADPVTGDPVPRTADTLIGGFMKLIGQEEVWENIKKGNAIARAWAWFQGALAGLMGFVRTIPVKIVTTITSLTIGDIVTVVGAFKKVVGAFVNIATDFISWGLNQVISLLEILFSVVAPGVMPYIAKARAAFTTILKNPIAFVGNLVKAGKMGFEMFASNILTHLKTALIKWIVGPLADAGVYIPKSFTLVEIIKLVLSVLGLTWQNIRSKLVKIIPEPVLVGLEKTAGILVALVKDGPVAAWEQIKTELTELKDQLITQITQMVSIEVVKAAIMKLVMMLNPAGAVVQAIIAIYNTITFFIQKINQIAAVVASFIDSISAIASGMVSNAAKKVEQTMANTLTVIIAFLAKFAGLGGIPNKLVAIVRKIRAPIDKGLDKIVAWLGNMLKKLASSVLGGNPNAPPEQRLQNGLREGTQAVNRLSGSRIGLAIITPVLAAIRLRNNMRSLQAERRGTRWAIVGEVNPKGESLTDKLVEEGTGSGNFKSQITYSGVNSLGFGTNMDANPVGPDHPAGSTVSKTLRLELREDRGSRQGIGSIAARQGKYRLGHLLNHHIGGPGNDWRNLTPLTPSANGLHSSQVEQKIKRLVNTHNRWVHYTVDAEYDGSPPTPGPHVHPFETQFARRLSWSYQIKKADPNNPNQLMNETQVIDGINPRGSDTVPNISAGFPGK